MKFLRIVGLLTILLAVTGGAMHDAHATAPITCWAECSGGPSYSGQCWASLERCCYFNQVFGCPDPYVVVAGDCTDGQNYCPS
jgi:hypothetical protein